MARKCLFVLLAVLATMFETSYSQPLLACSAVSYFESRGWTKAQACGIVGNLIVESNLNPAAVGDRGLAYGIAQWHPDRQAICSAFIGRNIRGSSATTQMTCVQHELENSERSAGNHIRAATTAGSAAIAVDKFYERSSGEARNRRVQEANTLFSGCQGGGGSAPEPEPFSEPAGGGSAPEPEPAPEPAGGGSAPEPEPAPEPAGGGSAPEPEPAPEPAGGGSAPEPEPAPEPAGGDSAPEPEPAPEPAGGGSAPEPEPAPEPEGGGGGSDNGAAPAPSPAKTGPRSRSKTGPPSRSKTGPPSRSKKGASKRSPSKTGPRSKKGASKRSPSKTGPRSKSNPRRNPSSKKTAPLRNGNSRTKRSPKNGPRSTSGPRNNKSGGNAGGKSGGNRGACSCKTMSKSRVTRSLRNLQTAPRRSGPIRSSAKRTPAKRAPAKRAPAKRAPAKRAPAKRTPAKRTPAKRTPAKRTPAKRTPAKRTPKGVPKRTAKRTPTKRTPSKRTPTKRTPTKRTPTKRTPTKRTPSKRTPTKRTPTKRTPSKRTPTKRAPSKKNPSKKNPSKKTPSKKNPSKKSPSKKAPCKCPASGKSGTKRSPKSSTTSSKRVPTKRSPASNTKTGPSKRSPSKTGPRGKTGPTSKSGPKKTAPANGNGNSRTKRSPKNGSSKSSPKGSPKSGPGNGGSEPAPPGSLSPPGNAQSAGDENTLSKPGLPQAVENLMGVFGVDKAQVRQLFGAVETKYQDGRKAITNAVQQVKVQLADSAAGLVQNTLQKVESNPFVQKTLAAFNVDPASFNTMAADSVRKAVSSGLDSVENKFMESEVGKDLALVDAGIQGGIKVAAEELGCDGTNGCDVPPGLVRFRNLRILQGNSSLGTPVVTMYFNAEWSPDAILAASGGAMQDQNAMAALITNALSNPQVMQAAIQAAALESSNPAIRSTVGTAVVAAVQATTPTFFQVPITGWDSVMSRPPTMAPVPPTAAPSSQQQLYVACRTNCPGGNPLLAPMCTFAVPCGNGCYCGTKPGVPSLFPTRVPTVSTFGQAGVTSSAPSRAPRLRTSSPTSIAPRSSSASKTARPSNPARTLAPTNQAQTPAPSQRPSASPAPSFKPTSFPSTTRQTNAPSTGTAGITTASAGDTSATSNTSVITGVAVGCVVLVVVLIAGCYFSSRGGKTKQEAFKDQILSLYLNQGGNQQGHYPSSSEMAPRRSSAFFEHGQFNRPQSPDSSPAFGVQLSPMDGGRRTSSRQSYAPHH